MQHPEDQEDKKKRGSGGEGKRWILQGEGRQMEIDGGRDWEIKRNTPLGVTEEGVTMRGMRGLQAWEGKKWSLKMFLHLSSSPSMFFPLWNLCSWERRSILVWSVNASRSLLLSVLYAHSTSLSGFLLWEAGWDYPMFRNGGEEASKYFLPTLLASHCNDICSAFSTFHQFCRFPSPFALVFFLFFCKEVCK